MALKHLVDLDLGGNEIQNVVLQNLATAPTGVAGQIFYDTAVSAVKVHTGSGFVRIGATADASTITESSGVFSVGTIAISNTSGLQDALDLKLETSALTPEAAIYKSGGDPTLADGVLASEIRTLIGASSFDGAYGSLSSIPTEFAPSAHVHELDEVNGLGTALNLLAPLAAPAFTGVPTAPTAIGGTDTTQIATTAFVSAEIGRVVDAAPAALDTLNELAASINDDTNFAGTVTTALGTKLASADYTAADVLTKIKTVDGAGSGLDADLLDGQSSAYYKNYNNLTNKPTIPTFVSVEVGGTGAGTDLGLGFGGFANIQIYEAGNLVMTDINQDGAGGATATLTSGVSFTVVAIGL